MKKSPKTRKKPERRDVAVPAIMTGRVVVVFRDVQGQDHLELHGFGSARIFETVRFTGRKVFRSQRAHVEVDVESFRKPRKGKQT